MCLQPGHLLRTHEFNLTAPLRYYLQRNRIKTKLMIPMSPITRPCALPLPGHPVTIIYPVDYAENLFSSHMKVISRSCHLCLQHSLSLCLSLSSFFLPLWLKVPSTLEYYHSFLGPLPATALAPATVSFPHGAQNSLKCINQFVLLSRVKSSCDFP